MKLPFKQVDVFTERPFAGNPVAVVLDGSDLDGEQMQRIANWTNLSETTFLLRPTQPGADYRLRIFTPREEFPFAGHPTLGSAHAALEAGLVTPRDGVVVQECGAGLVRVAVAGEGPSRRLTFELPPARVRELDGNEIAEVDAALGRETDRKTPARLVDVGPRWIVAQLPDADAVLALDPDPAGLTRLDRRLGSTGLTVFGRHPAGHEAAIEVRSFAPSSGIPEDPVCGSGNGSVAVFLRDTGLIRELGTRYTALQGRRVGRDGRIQVEVDPGGTVRVGGQCVTCIDGTLLT